MNKSIYNFLTLFFLCILSACSEELEYSSSQNSDEEGIPVEIVIEESKDFLTRSVDNPKIKFADGDVIHISGEFKNATGLTAQRYGAMKLTNGKWMPIDESSALKWPMDAVSGNFTAFYICDSDGSLLSGSLSAGSPINVKLDSLQDDKDPLKAETSDVVYGHAVTLSFSHICTHLTFKELEYGVTNEYWLVNNKNDRTMPFNNAFEFKLNNEKKLELNFIQIPDEDFDNLVYISRKFTTKAGEYGVRVSYFLEPGDYSDIELRSANNHPYLSWKSDNTASLEANKTYTVNIQKSTGVTIIEDTDVEWENDDPIEVDPEEFLRAIQEQKDYTVDNTPILRAVENGMLLLHCVSFNNKDKEYYDGFFADNPSGKIFDGNFHYISDLSFPLFRYNFGTIQNLGLKDLGTSVTSIDYGNDYNKDQSRQGGLCRWNRQGATIHNVRLENFSLTVKIQSSISEETHNAGCITGVNEGSISSVFTKGNFSLTVKNDNETPEVNCTVVAGGLIGQNIGVVRDITPSDEESAPSGDISTGTIFLVNECKGNSSTFILGGAIGQSSGPLDHIIVPNVSLTSSEESNGAMGYFGGLVGNLRASIGSPSSVIACMVGGQVNTGKITQYGIITSSSYTGGLAGAVMNFSILNCRSVCNVKGWKSSDDKVVFGCGGAIGRIISSEKIADLTIYGKELTSVPYIGCFAGIVPLGKTWEDVYSKDNNLVKKFDGIEYIGGSQDDTTATDSK